MSNIGFVLQKPYSDDFISGNLFFCNTSGRYRVNLIRADGTETSTNYARYLYTVHIGDYLPEGLHVDHINEDKTDDRLENLQLLTASENSIKAGRWRNENIVEYADLVCANCQKSFTVTIGELNRRNDKYHRASNYFCSRECVSNGQRYSDEIISAIRELDVPSNSSNYIACRLGLDVSAVIRYRNNLPVSGSGISLTNEMVDRINSFDPDQFSAHQIAEILGIGKNTVLKYQLKKNHKHARFSDEKISQIHHLIESGLTNAEISRRVLVDASTVSRLRSKCGK